MTEIKQEQTTIIPPMEKVVLSQEEQTEELLVAINMLVEKANEEPPPIKLTSTTKRLIAFGIFGMGLIVASGWAAGGINASDALIVISSITTGGFALLRL